MILRNSVLLPTVALLALAAVLSLPGPGMQGDGGDELSARSTQTLGDPVAVISPLPDRISNGTDKILSGSLSFDSDGEIVNYTWEIKFSGNVTYKYGMSKWYRFEVPGLYMIKLTVTDDENRTGVDFTATLSMTDSDEDGLMDWWEEYYLFNLDYGAADDPDEDGYHNIDEYFAGTDPRVHDEPPPSFLEEYAYHLLAASVGAAVALAFLYRRLRRKRKVDEQRKIDYAIEIEKALDAED
jgi:hypothetical protein